MDTNNQAQEGPNNSVGARIRRLREERGLSRAELCRAVSEAARHVGGRALGADTLAAWEGRGGTWTTPRADWIPALSKALDVTPAYLLTGEEWEG